MRKFNVFDGHNDFLYRLLKAGPSRKALWPIGDRSGHLDLPRMQRGGFVGGFFAIYVPSPNDPSIDYDALMDAPPYDLPLPPAIGFEEATAIAMTEAGHLRWMERASNGAFRICTTGSDLRHTIAAGGIAGIMHMEGAEAIDPDLDALQVWYAAGLRSVGPVWSRPTAFGHGVPFRFPGDPDTGDGLTPAGCRLVRECDKLGVLIDLSHLNEAGFDDVARLCTGPMIATHSNAHSVTASTRNLTDRQLHIIAESGGIVGLNFATVFLRPDGRRSADMGWDPVMRHLDHLLSILGEHGVAFGSDFDGAEVPKGIGDVTGVQNLCQAMLKHGYGDALVEKIAGENWLRFLDKALV